MDSVKYETLKVFDYYNFPPKCHDSLINHFQNYNAGNGSYVPYWLGNGGPVGLDEWLLANGAGANEKILIHWSW